VGLTLVEAAKLAPSVQQGAVIEMFARESDILRTLPFTPIQGNALRYNQEQTLPGVAFRGVNESYTPSTGIVNPKAEPLVISGGELDVDTFIIKTMGPVRAQHEQMKVKAIAADWTRAFIKGDSSTQPREFDGLQARITGAQKIAAGATAGGDALSLTKLDELIDAVDAPTHIIMTKAMRRLLTAAARNPAVTGYVTYSKDEFGRRVTQYNDLPILVPYGENGGTEPIAFDEANPGGGSAVGTSIYVVSFGSQRLEGIQNAPMDVRDLGELQSIPVFRTRVEWFAGLACWHGRAASRLWGIKNAAVVA
jgi:hypothetical protein